MGERVASLFARGRATRKGVCALLSHLLLSHTPSPSRVPHAHLLSHTTHLLISCRSTTHQSLDETHLASKKDVDTLGQLTCCGTPERRMPASARLQAQRVRSKGEFRQQEEIKSTTGWNTDKANSSVFDIEVKSMHRRARVQGGSV